MNINEIIKYTYYDDNKQYIVVIDKNKYCFYNIVYTLDELKQIFNADIVIFDDDELLNESEI